MTFHSNRGRRSPGKVVKKGLHVPEREFDTPVPASYT